MTDNDNEDEDGISFAWRKIHPDSHLLKQAKPSKPTVHPKTRGAIELLRGQDAFKFATIDWEGLSDGLSVYLTFLTPKIAPRFKRPFVNPKGELEQLQKDSRALAKSLRSSSRLLAHLNLDGGNRIDFEEKKFEVINGGLPASGIYAQNLFFQNTLAKYHPNAVI
ncbi:MAG: hypothetical protein JKY60_18395, partial [Kordiimonadaceae bacterium]|nr:hypothetical protein [Kordiimonadaceae bacterium]